MDDLFRVIEVPDLIIPRVASELDSERQDGLRRHFNIANLTEYHNRRRGVRINNDASDLPNPDSIPIRQEFNDV